MHRLIASALLTALLTACATNAPPQMPPSAPSVDRGAGTWRPWVLASGQELRLPAPPDASATAAEMDQLRALVTQRSPAMQERIRYWDFWSPSHLWNETLIDISSANPIPGGAAMRMFAMLNVAMNDAMIAAWDTKYTYSRPRPAEFDTRFRSVVATPRSPSYPCEHSVAAGAAATIIAHIYPKEGQRMSAAAEEAARSRVMAGAAFPSDTKAGLELGRAVAGRVIERMKVDGSKWAGTVPTGPGLWKGTNPVGVDEIAWKLFVLNSLNGEFWMATASMCSRAMRSNAETCASAVSAPKYFTEDDRASPAITSAMYLPCSSSVVIGWPTNPSEALLPITSVRI